MHTTTSASTGSTPLTAPRMATPPPPSFDLLAGDNVVGWIEGKKIGFRGFRDESEAAHAAWVAYRTVARRFASEAGRRPLPIDIEAMSLARSGDVEVILAGGRPIATLIRPAAASRTGADWFGFELDVPASAHELTMRSTAHLAYRALRRSGIRWAMWAPVQRAVSTSDEVRAADRERITEAQDSPRRSHPGTFRPRERARYIAGTGLSVAGTALILLVTLAVFVPSAITMVVVVPLLGATAALFALAALASLVHLVATDVRIALRQRDLRTRLRLGAARLFALVRLMASQRIARSRTRKLPKRGGALRGTP